MIAYKFLRAGAEGMFSGFRWPVPEGPSPGAWVEAGHPSPAGRGIHACRPDQLSHWFGPELWELEIDGTLATSGTVVVASRGRLVRLLTAWSEPTAKEYSASCAWRVTGHARTALTHAGRPDAAARLGRCADLASVLETSREIAAGLTGTARDSTDYAADSADFALGSHDLVKAVPFVAAHAAGQSRGERGTDAYGHGFMDERAWQAGWLTRRLGLGHGPDPSRPGDGAAGSTRSGTP